MPIRRKKYLTRRQAEALGHVYALAQAGRKATFAEVARRMGLSPHRVQQHVRQLHREGFLLSLTSPAELAPGRPCIVLKGRK